MVVRAIGQVEALREQLASIGDEPVARPMAADLWALYVLEGEDDIEPMTGAQRASLGLENGPLHVLAVRNTIADLEPVEREGDEGAYVLSEPGAHEEALIFVPSVWDWVARWLDGEPVACLPARDVLLVTGARNADGLARLEEAAAQVFAQDEDPISTTLLRRDGMRWVPFEPKANG